MKSLLLAIVLYGALSCACPLLKRTESATEKEPQFAEKQHLNTLNEMRKRRYAIKPDAPRWENKVVTYRISNYTKKMPRADVDEAMRNAFETWSNASCVNFTQSQNASDIEISFAAGKHGDEIDCTFDEESGELTHADSFYMFGNKGIIRFNEDENWTKDDRGINLYAIAVHKIGHVLGLDHSESDNAKMNKYYKSQNENFRLHQDDIEGIQFLYGKPGNCSHLRRYLEPPRKIRAVWRNAVDAVANFKGSLLFFAGNNVLLRNLVNIECRIQRIHDFWPALKCGISAAYEAEGILYIFYGDRYRNVSDNLSNLSSSRFIRTLGFPKPFVDAAVYDQETKKTLFFAGDEYWRYNEETKSVEKGYPRKTEDDFGIRASKVDAAFQLNGKLHLIRDNIEYVYNRRTYELIAIHHVSRWLECR